MNTTAKITPHRDASAKPSRRVIAAVVLLAWLGWVAACPEALVGVEGFAVGAPDRSVHAHADDLAGAAGDACCTALKNLSTTFQANNSKSSTITLVILPKLTADVVGAVAITAVALETRWLVHGPPPFLRRSPSLAPLWPHAPPR